MLSLRVGALAVLLVAGAPALAHAGDKPIDGRLLYLRHCAPCHGESGQGDGPDALIFAARPRNLREGFLQGYSTDDLVKRIRTGAQLELALDLPALRARAAETEAVVAHMRRLPAANWSQIEPGWEIYADRCESCHGPYGAPVRDLPKELRRPRDLSDPAFQKAVSDSALQTAVRHGHHYMPALVPRISVDEAKALTSFVRLLSPGFELYARYCSSCHGDDGRGVGSLGEAIPLPTVVFDRSYFARHDPEDIRHGVWHMLGEHKPAMPHFRWSLNEEQTRAIVEYLKKALPPTP